MFRVRMPGGRQCLICMQFFKNKKRFLSIFKGQCHQFCDKCCNEMYFTACESARKQLMCPECSSEFDTQSPFFTKKPEDQRQRFLISRFASRTIRCPTSECTNILSLSVSKPTKCYQCEVLFCHICIAPFHELSECPEYTQKLTLLQKFDYRICNKCLMVLEKSQGCQHMKCMCGHQFCYTCGEPWVRYHVCAHLKHKVESSIGALHVHREERRRTSCCCRRRRYEKIRISFFTCVMFFILFVLLFKLALYAFSKNVKQSSQEEIDEIWPVNSSAFAQNEHAKGILIEKGQMAR